MRQIILYLTVFFISCQEKTDATLEAAGKIHNEASAIAEEIEPQIEGIDSLQNVLNEKKKGLSATQIAKIDSMSAQLTAIKTAFETWEENIIEVPGMKHDHAEGEHHHHDHKPAPNVTSEQMLELQKEMKANIEKIKANLEKVTLDI